MIYLNAYVTVKVAYKHKIAAFTPAKGKHCRDNSSFFWHTKEKEKCGLENLMKRT